MVIPTELTTSIFKTLLRRAHCIGAFMSMQVKPSCQQNRYSTQAMGAIIMQVGYRKQAAIALIGCFFELIRPHFKANTPNKSNYVATQ